jgi:hypothetical protein
MAEKSVVSPNRIKALRAPEELGRLLNENIAEYGDSDDSDEAIILNETFLSGWEKYIIAFLNLSDISQ